MNNKSDAQQGGATPPATLSREKRCTKDAVSARLKEFRKGERLSQPELAKAAGAMPLPSYKDYEGGNRLPGAEAMDGFYDAGINLNWLVTGEGPKKRAIEASEPVATTYGAKAPPVDSVLLQQVIEFFDAWLVENRDSVRIDRSRHGAVIAILYRIAAQSGKVVKPDLEQVLRLAA